MSPYDRPCSGCNSRDCDGRCYDQSEADFDPLWETRKANEEALREKYAPELRLTEVTRDTDPKTGNDRIAA